MGVSEKESRGQSSLVSKMTFLETYRRFWLLVSTDILIIALFFCSLIGYGEYIAASVDFTLPEQGNYTITTLAEQPNGISLELYPRLPRFGAAIRNIWFSEPLRNITNTDYFGPLTSLKYSVAYPKLPPQAGYWLVTFDYSIPIFIFLHAFSILLLFEMFGLFVDSFKIRSSIRRSLRPIYDLTLMAQNMNASATPAVSLTGAGALPLPLSGAIDTLNNITENNLGRRIVISDEREELRGLAQAINAMLDRLDAAYRSQLRFVSDASHELRTPIAVIQGYANMLDRWGKNDVGTLQESIDAIKSEASGMQDLVEQLLFLARSDNRSIVLNVEMIDTHALADEVLRETQMIDPNHEFNARLAGGLVVRGDIQLLKQALRIFVDNAIKYTPQGGVITLSNVGEDDYVKISVSDTGVGIPAPDLERVFDRFFRSDESRTRGTGGTGLGLSIAKWIIDRHGGFVEIVSRVDFGTKITVALPRFNEQAVPLESEETRD